MELTTAIETLALPIDDEDERVWFMVELSKALITARQWDKAESVAHLIKDGYPRHHYEHALTLLALASSLIFFGQKEKTELVVEKAIASVRKIELMWQKAELLHKSASVIASTGKKKEAQCLLAEAAAAARNGERSESGQDSIDSSKVLHTISLEVAKAGHRIEAQDIAQKIANDGVRYRALTDIKKNNQSVQL